MLTDKARNIKDSLKIGDEITVEWQESHSRIKQKQKAKVFNVADVFFTTDKETAIFYNDVVSIVKQNELF